MIALLDEIECFSSGLDEYKLGPRACDAHRATCDGILTFEMTFYF